jgi:hypothetical protein
MPARERRVESIEADGLQLSWTRLPSSVWLRNRDPPDPAAAEVHSRNLALVGATECQRGRPSDSAAYLGLPGLRWTPRESSVSELHCMPAWGMVTL